MNLTNDDNRVVIFDTTLRDGEQSPGSSMNMAEKLELARALAAMGVDVIEAGFPIASVGDFEAVRAIATEVAGSSVCALARCNDRDIDRAWEAIQFAQQPRIVGLGRQSAGQPLDRGLFGVDPVGQAAFQRQRVGDQGALFVVDVPQLRPLQPGTDGSREGQGQHERPGPGAAAPARRGQRLQGLVHTAV